MNLSTARRIGFAVVIAGLAILAPACFVLHCAPSDPPNDTPDAGPPDIAPSDTSEHDAEPTDPPGDLRPPDPDGPVDLRLLAINDVHGHLEKRTGMVRVDGEEVSVGGAAHMATHLRQLADEVPHSTVVHSGDLIGAAPDISELFYGESTIRVFNRMGLDIAGVGNHEFGRGLSELLRLDEGTSPSSPHHPGDFDYTGADFDYLAANVTRDDSDEPVMPPYAIRNYDGIRVGYVGMTLEETPRHLVSRTRWNLTFHDEVETMETYLPQMKDDGVHAVVALIHDGAHAQDSKDDIGDCSDAEGPIVKIAEEMPDGVDVIVSGHTHNAYVCEFGGIPVTQARNSSRVITAIDLHIDPDDGVVDWSAEQQPVYLDVEPDPAIAKLVADYAERVDELEDDIVGELDGTATAGTADDSTPSAMGRLLADAYLEATGDSDIAFVDIEHAADELRGEVSLADLYRALRYNNSAVTMTMTGDQLQEVLEQQWQRGDEETITRRLAISEGFEYAWSSAEPAGERIDIESMRLHGESIDADADYRVTVSDYLADGGDGFSAFEGGTDRSSGIRDVEAMADFIETHPPLGPPREPRATQAD